MESYIEEKGMEIKDNLFVPSLSIFLKDHKEEFVIKYWLKTEKGICTFFDNMKKSCTIYPVRPLICRIYPVSFYLNNDKRSGLFNINSGCSTIEKDCIEKDSNFQRKEYAVIGKKKSFLNISKYLEEDSYRQEKLLMFIYVLADFFIHPGKVIPEIVKGYQRHDMSQFWGWILENKNKISALKKIKRYKELLSKLHESFNFNIKNFVE
jgi:Fe-S-cluster containining protein